MNKILRVCIFSLFVFSASISAQGFLSVEFLRDYTPAELEEATFFVTTFEHGVSAYKVTYESKDLDGNTVVLSGLLGMPQTLNKVYPVTCYMHGTSGTKENVPSNLELDAVLALSFAGKDFITIAPDFLGLGDHDGTHPYVHAASEAWVGVDMIRALREYAETNDDLYLNDQIFTTGYSQGGHAAMALHRSLELDLSDEFTVVASVPMSGPYSISGAMKDLILSGIEYTQPAYLINTFTSYQFVYGDVYTDIASTFKEPYQQVIEDFSNQTVSLSELNEELTNLLMANEGAVIPVKVMKDAYVDAVTNDPDHPMLIAMADNDVYDWAPDAPTRLLFCEADEEVPYENSLIAEEAMQMNGAADVEAISQGAIFSHFFCALPAGLSAVEFFQIYQELDDAPVSSYEASLTKIEIYPNPTTGIITLADSHMDGIVHVKTMEGKNLLSQTFGFGDNRMDWTELSPGMYLVEIISNNLHQTTKIIVQ